MAVSVRLPLDTGPYIEHYLIQSIDGSLSLESSRFKFDSIPSLIAHYAQCCDELPVRLVLPRALRDAKNRQQLSSLALLGQEFWRYPMAAPKPSPALSKASSHQTLKTPSEMTNTSGIGTTTFSHHVNPNASHNGGNQVDTPSDTTSSLSSFTISNGQQLLSPESIDNVIMTMSPTEPARTVGQSTFGSNNKCSTFKTKQTITNQEVEKQIQIFNNNLLGINNNNNNSTSNNNITTPNIFGNSNNMEALIRAPRPTPPNTLNLGALR
jgi:hypothetical protein